MKCERCKGKTVVTDTRIASDSSTRRRLKCMKCDHRFNSNEYTVDTLRDRDLDILKEMAAAFNSVYIDMKSRKGL